MASQTNNSTTSDFPEEHRQKDRYSDDIDENTMHTSTVTTLNTASNAALVSSSSLNHQAPRKRTTRKSETPRIQEDDGPPRRTSTRKSFKSLLIPDKKIGESPGLWRSLRAVIFASWLNVLLVFIPVSWALNFALPDTNPNRDTLVFVCSFLAIIPLAKLLGFATEELSLRVGQTLAGLLNATLGNAVELIVAIIALVKCELRIVQSSLVGSVLSNLLLVLGMCFFAGGVKYQEQGFGASASQLNSSLLTVSVIAVLLPAAFQFAAQLDNDTELREILAVSRGTSIILLIIYGGYLLFQLFSHSTLYDEDHVDVIKSTHYAGTEKRRAKKALKRQEKKEKENLEKRTILGPGNSITEEPDNERDPAVLNSVSRPGTNNSVSFAPGTRPGSDVENGSVSDKSVEEQPQMSVWATIILLIVVTVLVAVTAEWLVDSIDGLTDRGGISKEFVGIILLPIVGNAAEHLTAVTVSVKDKLTLSIGVAVGSSIQIALFVVPVIITLGWILGKPMTLLFDPYESVVLFLSVLTVNYVVQDGKSNWLEGFILMLLYVIVALSFWYYPGSDPISCQ